MNNKQISYINKIKEAIRQNRLVLFVGAGVSANSGVPTWNSLIESLKRDLSNCVQEEHDALKIAQIYKDTFGHKAYIEKVRETLKYDKVAPNPIHQLILKLNPNHIITTNYDNLIESAIKENYLQYDIIAKDSDLPYFRYPNKYVKMHGDFDNNNIVLSEDEYYNYSRNFPLVRAFVQSLFATNIVLFIGFSFTDYNLKLIMNDLKEILNKDLQRVYLLSDVDDCTMINYFENRGVNIVNILEEVNRFKFSNEQEKNIASVKSEKGKLLYKELSILLADDLDGTDLLSHLYQKIITFNNELTTLGTSVKHIFPKSEREIWNFHSSGIQIFSPYIKELTIQLKNRQGVKDFIKKHNIKERRILLQYACASRIYDLDGLNFKEYFKNKKIIDPLTEPIFEGFYSLDYIGLSATILELRNTPLSFSKADLRLPYILCRLGKYCEAIQIYKNLMPKFWQRNLYILYFICCYNLYNLRFKIFNERINDITIDKNAIMQELSEINLSEILQKLPIEKDIKAVLEDLVSSNIFSTEANSAEKFKEEINRQRVSAENGGVSINSNIVLLISKFTQAFIFLSENYLINNNQYFDSICKDAIIGILNSHATPETVFENIPFRSTRIIEIEPYMLNPMIFFIDASELDKTISQYKIDKIVLNEASVETVNNMLINLLKALSKDSFDSYLITYRHYLVNYICNLILIISKTKQDDIDAETLYKIIALFWENGSNRLEEFYLTKLIKTYRPSSILAQRLLDDAVLRYIQFDSNSALDAIALLIDQVVVNDYTLKISNEDLTKNNLDFGLYVYKFLPERQQKFFIDYFDKNTNDINQYLYFHNKYRLKIEQSCLLNLMTGQQVYQGDEYKYNDYRRIVLLSSCRQIVEFSDIHQDIDNLCGGSPLYNFLLKPREFDKPQLIKPFWLLACSEEDRLWLLNTYNELKTQTKLYILEEETGKLNFDSFYKLL